MTAWAVRVCVISAACLSPVKWPTKQTQALRAVNRLRRFTGMWSVIEQNLKFRGNHRVVIYNTANESTDRPILASNNKYSYLPEWSIGWALDAQIIGRL